MAQGRGLASPSSSPSDPRDSERREREQLDTPRESGDLWSDEDVWQPRWRHSLDPGESSVPFDAGSIACSSHSLSVRAMRATTLPDAVGRADPMDFADVLLRTESDMAAIRDFEAQVEAEDEAHARAATSLRCSTRPLVLLRPAMIAGRQRWYP